MLYSFILFCTLLCCMLRRVVLLDAKAPVSICVCLFYASVSPLNHLFVHPFHAPFWFPFPPLENSLPTDPFPPNHTSHPSKIFAPVSVVAHPKPSVSFYTPVSMSAVKTSFFRVGSQRLGRTHISPNHPPSSPPHPPP